MDRSWQCCKAHISSCIFQHRVEDPRPVGRRSMPDYGFVHYASKADMLTRSGEVWNPDKTAFWQRLGVDLVIDRRQGYVLTDMDGRRLIDMHLNGGTYNLGHRNAE